MTATILACSPVSDLDVTGFFAELRGFTGISVKGAYFLITAVINDVRKTSKIRNMKTKPMPNMARLKPSIIRSDIAADHLCRKTASY